ncbi:MAG: alpha-L-fucosidase [Pirellulales bacterium]
MKYNSMFAIVAFGAAVLMGPLLCPSEPATERTAAIARYETLRYGVFFHFGIISFLDQSFQDTKNGPLPPSRTYCPTDLDVDQWITTAKKAGMRYAVLTVKHHLGHALWDSKTTDYDVATSGCKTDVVAEFVKACRRHGVAPCFLYSLGQDVAHRRDRALNNDEWYTHANSQITELLTNYIPREVVAVLFKEHDWFWRAGQRPLPVATLLESYRDATGRGANWTLTAAPDKSGKLPADQVKRLLELGRRIQRLKQQESLRNTRPQLTPRRPARSSHLSGPTPTKPSAGLEKKSQRAARGAVSLCCSLETVLTSLEQQD